MSELDFSRDNVPHQRGNPPPRAISESDNFCRTQLLPMLFRLDVEQRSRFDSKFIAHFAPEVDEHTRFAAQLVLRRLDLEQLHLTADAIQVFLDKQPA